MPKRLGPAHFWGGPESKWECRTSTRPSRVSLERRSRLLSKGKGYIITHGWDKIEIPAKSLAEEPPTKRPGTNPAAGIRGEGSGAH